MKSAQAILDKKKKFFSTQTIHTWCEKAKCACDYKPARTALAVFLARFLITVTVFLLSRTLSSVLIAWLIKELRAIGKASQKERDSVLGEKTTLMK